MESGARELDQICVLCVCVSVTQLDTFAINDWME